MSLVLWSSDRFTGHQTPSGHPDSPERAEVMEVIAEEWRREGGEVVVPVAATHDQLARVHDREHLRRMTELAGSSVALDADTYTSTETHDVALLAAGAAVQAVEHVLQGEHRRAFALVRPPGHHAEPSRAMGFCLYNNVAVAAAHARALGASRVAIVDYDVHHGNGTQHAFKSDASVLYVSAHQHPFYPGTGDVEDIGRDAGSGYTVNLPLEVGAVDEDYRVVFAEVILPILRQFEPDLLMVSAGFDAHERDPLAGMRLSTEAFGAMTMDLRAAADECCDGRIVAVTEGGYDLPALGDSLRAVVTELASESPNHTRWPAPGAVLPSRGRAVALTVKKAFARHWRL